MQKSKPPTPLARQYERAGHQVLQDQRKAVRVAKPKRLTATQLARKYESAARQARKFCDNTVLSVLPIGFTVRGGRSHAHTYLVCLDAPRTNKR